MLIDCFSCDRDYAAFRELCRVVPGFTQHMQATDMEVVDDLDTYFDDVSVKNIFLLVQERGGAC